MDEFPIKLKLGKCPDPANTGELNKILKRAKGIIIVLYDGNSLQFFLHGNLTNQDFVETVYVLMNEAIHQSYEAGIHLRKKELKNYMI